MGLLKASPMSRVLHQARAYHVSVECLPRVIIPHLIRASRHHMAIIAQEVRAGFELLRPVFAGIAARHDQVLSRVVVAESGYEQFLGGPPDDDWRDKQRIAFTGLVLRNNTI